MYVYCIYSLWFDSTGARTHDLPHSSWACSPLHHRYGSQEFTSGNITRNNTLIERTIMELSCKSAIHTSNPQVILQIVKLRSTTIKPNQEVQLKQ